MTRREGRSERAAKTTSPDRPASRDHEATGGSADWIGRLGNRAAHDARVGAWWTAAHGPSAERAASDLAQAVTGKRSPGGHDSHDRRATSFAMPAAHGDPLPAAIRAPIERVTGESFADVGVHRMRLAPRGIAAATYGASIAMDRDVSRSPDAGWILAHELGHVLQQRRAGTRTVALQPRDPFGNQRIRDDEIKADFDRGGDESDPEYRLHRETDIEIAGPSLEDPAVRQRRAEEIATIHARGTDPPQVITHYAIPIAQVARIVLPTVPSPDTMAPPTPTPTAAPPTPAAAQPQAPPPPGSQIATMDGTVHTVLASDADYVVVEQFTKYAVKSGSISLVRTPQGFFLVDAGKQGKPESQTRRRGRGRGRAVAATTATMARPDRPESLTESLVRKVKERVGSERILGVLTTHAHLDHINMLAVLAAHMDLGDIFVNDWQRADPHFDAELTKVHDAIVARRASARAALLADPVARAEFMAQLEVGSESARAISPDVAQRAWEREVSRRTAPTHETRVLTVQRVDGRMRPHLVRTLGVTGPDARPRLTTESELALDGPNLIGFSDAALGQEHARTAENTDRFATHWVMTINDGARFLIIPDIRAKDFEALRAEFTAAVARSGEGRSVQFWDATHHGRVGFTHGTAPTDDHAFGSEKRATDIRLALQLLHDFRARKGTGVHGQDGIITSVNASSVDMGVIDLMRSLGFEVFVAIDGSDVRMFEIRTATGEVIHGVHGRSLGRVGVETMRRAHAARDAIKAEQAEIAEKIERLAAEGSPTEALQERSQVLERQKAAMLALEQAYTRAVDRPGRGRRPSDPVPDVDPAETERAALERWLDREGFPDLISSGSLELTTVALFLANEPPGAPRPGAQLSVAEAESRARGRRLVQMRTNINELHRDIRDKRVPSETTARLYLLAELDAYRSELRQLIDETEDGSSKKIFEAELARTEQALVNAVPETQSVSRRAPVTGELITTQVVKIEEVADLKDELRRRRLIGGMMRVLDVVGRGMGAVMLITSVRGSADIMDRYEAGRANAAEAFAGLARNATSGVIGVQMLRGARVGPSSFVILSVLEVGEAAFADYDSSAARDKAITRAVVHGAVNVGCMVAGDALMAAGAASLNPLLFAVGAAVSFIGPLLLNALFDWLTDEEPFQPKVITNLYEKLQRLLQEYRMVTGSLAVARRRGRALAEVGGDVAITDAALASTANHLDQALVLEPRVLDAFAEAYEQARENHMGLPQLDMWRAEFLELRHAATPTEDEAKGIDRTAPFILVDGLPYRRPVRVDALERFRTIETILVERSGAMTARDVANMSQWRKLSEGMRQLNEAVDGVDNTETWAHVMTKLDEVETMVDNARYRIDPSSGEARIASLIPEGTYARDEYDVRLEGAERELQEIRLKIAKSPAEEPADPSDGLLLDMSAVTDPSLADADTSSNGLVIDPAAPGALILLPDRQAFALGRVTAPDLSGAVDDGGVPLDALVLQQNVPDGTTAGGLIFPGVGLPVVRLPASPETQAIRHAEDAVNMYEDTLQPIGLPEGFAADKLKARSSEAKRYQGYIESHRTFRLRLAELEVKERTAQVLVHAARRALGSDADPLSWNGTWLATVERRLAEIVERRKVVRNLLFSSEVPASFKESQQAELDFFADLFEVKGAPLSPNEERVLAKLDASLTRGPIGIGDRLELIPDLHVPTDPTEKLASFGLYRPRPDAEGLVGVVKMFMGAYPRVIPLDAAAEALFGSREPQIIRPEHFHALTLEELHDRLMLSGAP